ncbi:hypothetical protein SETIT_9G073500v2 [Setaria italica]|uniref:Ubiquitin-like protease family profile domain-containing protein n=1 Tax=Setaria italica TaxID=4555 RepID=A0A368SE87_SETIT|nr:hypothetical protein SETIT_9G073500v2 [Setaria italica]
MVQIGDHMVTKTTFRESLKPDGWMSSFVMDAQCEIWRSQWPDKIILTNYASKELLDQNGTKSLDKELNEENVNNAKQIFVPVNAERVHWILVVMDFDKHKVQILDSFASETYLVPAYKVASQLELYLMTKFNLHTGYPKERDLKLEKQKNINDCGFHVLLYIQRYGRSDMYKIDTEQILCYRKQLAYELKHESNDHPSTSTLNLDDSPLHVYSARPPPGRSTTSPSVSGSLSATESDPLGAKKQSAEEEGTSSNRLVPNEKEEGAAAHTKRKGRRTEKAVGTPVVSQRPDTGAAAQELCNLLLKADPNSESNLISFPSLKMTIKEGVTFLRDGSATIEMLRETIKIIRGFEAKNPNRYKIIVGPMDMSTLDDTGSEAFKDAVKTQMVVPSIPQDCKMVFLPVKKGSNWLVYCINGVCKRIDYLICSSNEEPMAATELCKPLLKEVDFHGRKMFGFMDWSPAVVPLEKKISSSDTGLLAMYFMEKYNGKQFSLEDIEISTWSESYRKSLLYLLFSQRVNSPSKKLKALEQMTKKMKK